eukprot:Skav221091  [mRNA]  locus=scaffold1024:105675:110399:- [translate_table: standard]
MIVHVQTGYVSFFIGIAHAPHSGHSRQDRQQWWDSWQDLLLQYDSSQLVILIDANATTGPADMPLIPVHGDALHPSSGFLRDFLQSLDLTPSAAMTVHQGQQHTWTSPDGFTQRRLDFVLMPRAWTDFCTYSSVLDRVDLHLGLYDHQAIGAQFSWTTPATPSLPSLPSSTWQRTSIADSAPLRQLLGQLDRPTWDADVESHAQHLEQQFSHCLRTTSRRQPADPKKPYMTPELWQQRQDLRLIRDQLRHIGRQQNASFLGAFLKAWRGASRRGQWRVWHRAHDDHQADRLHLHAEGLHISRLLRVGKLYSAKKLFRSALKKHRKLYTQEILDQIHPEMSSADILRLLKPLTGPTNPKKRVHRALPQVCHADGTLCRTVQEARDRWIEFFGNMEGGTRMSYAELHAHWCSNLHRFAQQSSQTLAITDLPTLGQLERACSQVKPGKAVGLDHMPPELCAGHPQEVARSLYGLLMKAMTFGQEPLSYKGGRLVHAWKGKAAASECSSHRSLLISSHLGKVLHRSIRDHQAHYFEAFLQTSQTGGRRHIPVTLPLHQGRAFLRWNHGRGRSTAMIYLDLTEAFYRVLRPLVLEDTLTDQQIAFAAKAMGVSPSDMTGLQDLLTQPCALEQACLPPHLRRCITAIHSDTFFKMDHQPDVTRTTIGTRPGDSFADIVFSFLWAVVLKDLEAWMADQDLLERVPSRLGTDPWQTPSGSCGFLGPCWMDDLCVVLSASDAITIEKKASIVTGYLLDLCHARALSPNLKVGKTEVLFTFKGAGAKQQRLKHYGPEGHRHLPVLCEHGLHRVPIATSYTHLGGLTHHTGHTRPELLRRAALAHQCFTDHRRLIFGNPVIARKKRAELLNSLVMSKLLYNSESWLLSTQADLQRWQTAVSRMYKRFAQLSPAEHLTHEALANRADMPDATTLLRRSRLRYLGTLFQTSYPSTWTVIAEDSQWIGQLEDDFGWMWRQICGTSELPDPAQDRDPWLRVLRDHPRYWKKLVRRAVYHQMLQTSLRLAVVDAHDRAIQILASQPIHFAQAESLDDAPATAHYGCLLCQKSFRTKAAESAHMARKHGQIDRVRYLFSGTHCPECLVEYHSAPGVQRHLRRSTSCRQALDARRVRCLPDAGIGSAAARHQQAAHDGLLPALRQQGPLPCPIEGVEIDEHHDEFLLRLHALLLDHAGPLDTEYALAQIDQILKETAISWTHLCYTLDYLLTQISDEDLIHLSVTQQDFHAMIAQLRDPDRWPFLHSEHGHRPPSGSLHRVHWAFTHASWTDDAPLPDPVPRKVGRDAVILHLFAGRRRRGDYQFFLEKLPAPDGTVLHTVSLDLMIDAVYGDVMRPETRRFWMDGIARSWVYGLLAGPPCETWTQARDQALTTASGRHPPRRLRDRDQPWGFSSLSLRELTQLLTGNGLLTFTAEALLALWCTGGIGIVEHPAIPDQEDAPSIWRTPLFLLMRRLPGFSFHHIHQGMLGAPSAKATHLLGLRLPTLTGAVSEWQVCDHMPKGASIGLDSSGCFRTSILKEYPPALCSALAQATWRSVVSDPAISPIPADFLAQCKAMVAEYSSFLGKDFAG